MSRPRRTQSFVGSTPRTTQCVSLQEKLRWDSSLLARHIADLIKSFCFQLDANHTLKIFDASFADDGLYYCNVTNKYGLNRATNMLEVYSKKACASVIYYSDMII